MGKNNKYGNPGKQWIDSMSGKNRDLEERFGIDSVSFGGRPGESSQREAFQDMQSYNERMTDAARNDYDLRRTIEAAAMSGKKKAQDILDKGFNSIDDVRNAQNFSEKAAKRHGQGGDFADNSDYMGLTRSMVDRDRRKQTEEYEKAFASMDSLEELRETVKENAENAAPVEAPELSDTLVNANEDSEEYSLNLGDIGTQLFGTPGGDDLSNAQVEAEVSPTSGNSDEFANDYLDNVKEGIKLSGIKTRGPGSGINGEGF